MPYPVFLNLVRRPVLVVGGGAVGLRKTRGLLACGARVTIVSPVFEPGFDEITGVERVEAAYAAAHMTRRAWRLVFAATDVQRVNAQVEKGAAAAGILCCRCDEPEAGDFSGGAHERIGNTQPAGGKGGQRNGKSGGAGGVMLAVSTAGASPALAARICREAAAGIDPVLPLLADLLAEWRAAVKTAILDIGARRALLQRVAGREMEEILRQKGVGAARRAFKKWLAAAKREGRGLSAAAVAAVTRSTRAVRHAQ